MNILITGGASGLGKSITETLAKDATNKVYFSYSKSTSAAQRLEATFQNSVAVHCDFAAKESVQLLVERITEFDLDVIIHNAYSGDYLKTHFHKIDAPDFLIDFKTNVLPIIELTQAAITTFRKKKNGKIITVLTSALIDAPPIGSSVYVANKAYIQKLTQVWANENGKFNITSNSVSPSFMETAMTSTIDERVKEQIVANNPLKRLLTTDEVAKAIEFLVNDTTLINGKDFVINAGSVLK